MRRVIWLGYQPKAVKPGSEVAFAEWQREQVVRLLGEGMPQRRVAEVVGVSWWAVRQLASQSRRAA